MFYLLGVRIEANDGGDIHYYYYFNYYYFQISVAFI